MDNGDDSACLKVKSQGADCEESMVAEDGFFCVRGLKGTYNADIKCPGKHSKNYMKKDDETDGRTHCMRRKPKDGDCEDYEKLHDGKICITYA